jgi:hypothetical protein
MRASSHELDDAGATHGPKPTTCRLSGSSARLGPRGGAASVARSPRTKKRGKFAGVPSAVEAEKRNGRAFGAERLGPSISWKWRCRAFELPELHDDVVAGGVAGGDRRQREVDRPVGESVDDAGHRARRRGEHFVAVEGVVPEHAV